MIAGVHMFRRTKLWKFKIRFPSFEVIADVKNDRNDLKINYQIFEVIVGLRRCSS